MSVFSPSKHLCHCGQIIPSLCHQTTKPSSRRLFVCTCDQKINLSWTLKCRLCRGASFLPSSLSHHDNVDACVPDVSTSRKICFWWFLDYIWPYRTWPVVSQQESDLVKETTVPICTVQYLSQYLYLRWWSWELKLLWEGPKWHSWLLLIYYADLYSALWTFPLRCFCVSNAWSQTRSTYTDAEIRFKIVK